MLQKIILLFHSLGETDEKRNNTISHLHLKHAPKPHLGYGIISFFCVLAPEGMNAIVFGEGWGRNQKTTAYSEGISSEDYFLSLMSSKEKGLVIS